jgi:hypothetical protein
MPVSLRLTSQRPVSDRRDARDLSAWSMSTRSRSTLELSMIRRSFAHEPNAVNIRRHGDQMTIQPAYAA